VLLAEAGHQVGAGAILSARQASSETSSPAADLLARARVSRGTRAAWSRIHTLTVEETRKWIESPDPPGSSDTLIFRPPDDFRWVNGSVIHTIIGEKYTQNHDNPAAILQMARRNVFKTFVITELVYLLTWPKAFPLRVDVAQPGAFNGTAVDVLTFSGPDGFKMDLSLERATGLPVAFSTPGRAGSLADYREVEGVRFPFKSEGYTSGSGTRTFPVLDTVSRLIVNSPPRFPGTDAQ
jgi:hypothetical protein